ARAGAGERAANGPSHKIDASLIDAHQTDDVTVLRDRADGGPNVRSLQEEIERGRSRQRHAEGQQARVADIDAADLDDWQPHPYIAEISGEDEGREALQEIEQPAGGEQLIDRRRAENRSDDQEVDKHAEDGTADNSHGECKRKRPAEHGK